MSGSGQQVAWVDTEATYGCYGALIMHLLRIRTSGAWRAWFLCGSGVREDGDAREFEVCVQAFA